MEALPQVVRQRFLTEDNPSKASTPREAKMINPIW